MFLGRVAADTHVGHGTAGGRHKHGGSTLVLRLGLTLKSQSHSIDAGVQRAHDGQRYPEVAELQKEVEDGHLHVLHIAHAVRNGSLADKVLPADD